MGTSDSSSLSREEVFSIACQEAYADGTLEAEEKKILKSLQKALRIQPERAKAILAEAKASGKGVSAGALDPAVTFRRAAELAWSDHELERAELQALTHLAGALGIPGPQAKRILDEVCAATEKIRLDVLRGRSQEASSPPAPEPAPTPEPPLSEPDAASKAAPGPAPEAAGDPEPTPRPAPEPRPKGKVAAAAVSAAAPSAGVPSWLRGMVVGVVVVGVLGALYVAGTSFAHWRSAHERPSARWESFRRPLARLAGFEGRVPRAPELKAKLQEQIQRSQKAMATGEGPTPPPVPEDEAERFEGALRELEEVLAWQREHPREAATAGKLDDLGVRSLLVILAMKRSYAMGGAVGKPGRVSLDRSLLAEAEAIVDATKGVAAADAANYRLAMELFFLAFYASEETYAAHPKVYERFVDLVEAYLEERLEDLSKISVRVLGHIERDFLDIGRRDLGRRLADALQGTGDEKVRDEDLSRSLRGAITAGEQAQLELFRKLFSERSTDDAVIRERLQLYLGELERTLDQTTERAQAALGALGDDGMSDAALRRWLEQYLAQAESRRTLLQATKTALARGYLPAADRHFRKLMEIPPLPGLK